MTGDRQDGSAEGGQRSGLARAQLASVLQNIQLTLTANVLIALTAALVVSFGTSGSSVFFWFGAVVLVGSFRLALVHAIRSGYIDAGQPERSLKHLTFLALLGGISWCPLPLYYADLTRSQDAAYIIFIIAGTAAGAVIQSLAFWRIAIAFVLPLMTVTMVRLVLDHSNISTVIALDLLILSIMLVRAAVYGQRSFERTYYTAYRATTLADSLFEANAEVRQANLALETLAKTDALTGLANRVRFNECVAASVQEGLSSALILFDLDRFKLINDTRGHKTGDAVLQVVARRLAAVCRGGELAIRLGGDEFAVLVTGEAAATRAQTIAGAMIAALAEPLQIDHQVLPVGISAGIAVAGGTSLSSDTLYAEADMALYGAKEQGRGRIVVFDAAMGRDLGLRHLIEQDLAAALERGDIAVDFQPQVTLATGAIDSFEALLRWTHPTAGPIAPPEIVRAANRLSLSSALTERVCRLSCAFLATLTEAGFGHVRCSVNISPAEFSLYSPAHVLKRVAATYAVPASRLEVEITEETLFDPVRAAEELARLRSHGFRLAIDDFGAGHSSIANMVALGNGRLKIDRRFIHGIAGNARNRQLVGAIAAVAAPLGYEVLAEGIESATDAETARLLGCRYGQGWHFGMPMSAAMALARLQAQSAASIAESAPVSLSQSAL